MASKIEKQIAKRLKFIYPTEKDLNKKVEKIINKYKDKPVIKKKKENWKLKNNQKFTNKDSILITYGDSIKKKGELPLTTLNNFLKEHVKDSISSVHILPFSPYSSDDGFSVIDYKQVDPKLGTWKEIREIGKNYRLMADLVVNHISSKSKWFKEFLKGNPKYQDYFIHFPNNLNTKEEKQLEKNIQKVFRPRISPLLTNFKTKNGEKRVWTTFSADQIDLNFECTEVFLEMIDTLLYYLSQGIEIIRLDAIGFLWKELGTICFHHKKTHEMVKLFRDICEYVAPYSVIIAEANVVYEDNITYFGKTDEAHMIYQFSLPPLTIDAYLRQNASYLGKLLKLTSKVNKQNLFFNFLASHDGVGVLGGKIFMSPKEINGMIEGVKKHNGLISFKNTPKGKIPYEMNINYLDAINNPNKKTTTDTEVAKFIGSQSTIVFSKGIPGIYIHSLLGSRNWTTGVKKSKINRRINREKLSSTKLSKELNNKNSLRHKVFQEYLEMLEHRKRHPEFNPYNKETVLKTQKEILAVEHKNNKSTIIHVLNVSNKTIEVKNIGKYTTKQLSFSGTIEPYQYYLLKKQ